MDIGNILSGIEVERADLDDIDELLSATITISGVIKLMFTRVNNSSYVRLNGGAFPLPLTDARGVVLWNEGENNGPGRFIEIVFITEVVEADDFVATVRYINPGTADDNGRLSPVFDEVIFMDTFATPILRQTFMNRFMVGLEQATGPVVQFAANRSLERRQNIEHPLFESVQAENFARFCMGISIDREFNANQIIRYKLFKKF